MIERDRVSSPSFLFDLDEFQARCRKARAVLGLPLTFSMKANPFLTDQVPEEISHIEVCSPGELSICKSLKVPPEKIIYSGVVKEAEDVREAVEYGVGLLTAESPLHVRLENEAVLEKNRKEACGRLSSPADAEKNFKKAPVLLRLTSGNQFGMSEQDILSLVRDREAYPGLDFYGIHYYSGTQKNQRQIRKDFERLRRLLSLLKEETGFEPRLVEYGPGAAVDYFTDRTGQADWTAFAETAEQIHAFSADYPTGIEMGRFLAATCGHYLTTVKDSKENSETNYLLLDGGIHHLKYYGQTMAMQVPFVNVIPAGQKEFSLTEDSLTEAVSGAVPSEKPYMLCGSLCTTADVLVREIPLPEMQVGDALLFHRCGAYSVTEGTVLFLSRPLPKIYLYSEKEGLSLARDTVAAADLNRNAAPHACQGI